MHTNDKIIKDIALTAFPEYRGRKFQIVPQEKVDVSYGNYWDGGTRCYYTFVNLSNRKTMPMASMHPYFDKQPKDPNVILPEHIVCVVHSYFCGKDSGLKVLCHPNMINKFLPPAEDDLTEEEKLLIELTGSLKSSYAGVKDVRKKEAMRKGLTSEQVDQIRESLREKGYLDKRNALTIKGKNHRGF